jgi:hypothetical protein
LWTFHLYVAPAYGVYISKLIWYSRACDSHQNFLDIGLLLTRKLLNQGFLLVKLKSSLRKFYGRHHDLVDRYGISVTNDHRHVPLVINISWSFPHWWIITGFVTRSTQWLPLVEQEWLTLLDHLSSPPVFSGVCVTLSLALCVCFVDRWLFFWSFCCLWFTDSDYSLGIFKLFYVSYSFICPQNNLISLGKCYTQEFWKV